jgi:RiboL-PSP-HEPN
MKNIEVVRYKQQLDDLFAKISNLPVEEEIQSHWARYLCIRVSGFLEISISSIYSKYAKDKSAPFVANYIEKKLSSFQNPTMDKITKLVSDFSPEWSEQLKELVDGEIKDSIDSIVAVRNQIAHGGNVGITYVRIGNYYKVAIKLIDILEKQCNDELP